ncbi:MAG: transcription termination factor Rho [Verrucomicrobiota bacterium]
MSSEEDNTQTTLGGEISRTSDRPAKKKAAKKRVANKKAVKAESAENVPAKTASPEPVYSSDRDDVGAFEPASPISKQPEAPKENKSNEGQAPQEGGQNGHSQERGGRNHSKSKNNKRKPKGKNRWQNNNNNNRKRRPREEETSIELGELLEYEALQSVDSIKELLAAIESDASTSLNFNDIYEMPLPELRATAEAKAVETPNAPNRDQLLNAIIINAFAGKELIETVGVLELLEDDQGGLLVYERDSYRVKALSAYVPQALIEHYGLLRGHIVKAQLHPHRENESCPFVLKITEVMGRDPETLKEIVPFTERVPYYPLQRILMESDTESKSDNLSMRVVDCLTPVGFGQRGLIVAPPRTGKTVLMQGMAHSIQRNYPDAHLIILLIDERPEEVTDFRRQVKGEVISSTFDESAESHVHAAEMVIEKARRMVEVGEDVVILLDSITRLARAYNTTMPSSGKILSGGVEASALQKPKRFFGSARNIEDGGSLTIIATALVETGSKMDEVIFEEFKGTGNMELHLDRGLSDKRIFPALSMDKSGTRKEELLYHPDEMQKIYSLRRAMKGLPSTDAMEMLIQRIKKTNTNAEFLISVSR